MSILEKRSGEREETRPPLAHLSLDPDRRVALCGAPILGIKAFGTHEPCQACLAERERLRGKVWL